MLDLFSVGDLKWLVILPVARFPRRGEMTLITGVQRLLGNDAAIVALLAARLGMHSCLFPTNTIARRDGQPLLDLLQQEGVDVSLIDFDGLVTPITLFLTHLSSDDRSWMVEDCAFRDPSTLDVLPNSTFAYLDLYEEHLEERLALLQRWLQTPVRCLVNLSASNLKEKVRLLARLPPTEIIQMRGAGDVSSARIWGRRVLQKCSARAAVITLGSLGVVLVDQYGDYFVAAEQIRPLRTVGAGAAFAAGLLYALSGGATYWDAVAFASRHAATFCTSSEHPLEVMKL